MIRRHYFTAEVFVPATQAPEKCEVEYDLEDWGIGTRAILRKVTRDNGDNIKNELDADSMSVLQSEALERYREEG